MPGRFVRLLAGLAVAVLAFFASVGLVTDAAETSSARTVQAATNRARELLPSGSVRGSERARAGVRHRRVAAHRQQASGAEIDDQQDDDDDASTRSRDHERASARRSPARDFAFRPVVSLASDGVRNELDRPPRA